MHGVVIRGIESPIPNLSCQRIFNDVESFFFDREMSHGSDNFRQENVQFIVETIGSEEKSIGVPGERITHACDVCIVTEFVDAVINKTNV